MVEKYNYWKNHLKTLSVDLDKELSDHYFYKVKDVKNIVEQNTFSNYFSHPDEVNYSAVAQLFTRLKNEFTDFIQNCNDDEFVGIIKDDNGKVIWVKYDTDKMLKLFLDNSEHLWNPEEVAELRIKIKLK
ncbi:hypothetical protein [Mesomycoplasma lagogenitalium]|uniref:Uncharacterized protein n=1 Tax=Mesomycoplasma lagogenitalium TaxID=171286 RepID=A0ABY8LT88_9BACT|nr:hypothetical protein [Mesomycoplasma lagogenitalium]WGI36457.1 hypothetical protein QEG99_03260 [Mesomycoplasma lagogenitalium]